MAMVRKVNRSGLNKASTASYSYVVLEGIGLLQGQNITVESTSVGTTTTGKWSGTIEYAWTDAGDSINRGLVRLDCDVVPVKGGGEDPNTISSGTRQDYVSDYCRFRVDSDPWSGNLPTNLYNE